MLGELQRDGLCDATLAERLFWTVLEHLQKLSPGFATGRQGKGLARPFRRVAPVSTVDEGYVRLKGGITAAFTSMTGQGTPWTLKMPVSMRVK